MLSNNTDLWAYLPGKLNSSLNHNFMFYNLKLNETSNDYETTLNFKKTTVLEQIKFKNYNFSAKHVKIKIKYFTERSTNKNDKCGSTTKFR